MTFLYPNGGIWPHIKIFRYFSFNVLTSVDVTFVNGNFLHDVCCVKRNPHVRIKYLCHFVLLIEKMDFMVEFYTVSEFIRGNTTALHQV